MGRGIANYNGGVQAVSATHPYGQIKNNPAGTVIDVTSNGDMQQFFQRISALGGISLNGLEDNADNGWQFVDALGVGINEYAKQAVLQLIGAANYSTSAWYLLSGSTTSAVAGYVFHDGFIYHLGNYTGPICGGGTVLVGTVLPSTSNTFMQEINLSCAASGSGDFNYSDLVRVWGADAIRADVAMEAWVNATITGSGWAAYVPTPRYRKDGLGRVYLQGTFRSTGASPATDVFVLPVGYRPSAETLFPVMGYNASVFIAGYIRIRTDGTVQVLTSGTITGANWYYDMGSIIYLNS